MEIKGYPHLCVFATRDRACVSGKVHIFIHLPPRSASTFAALMVAMPFVLLSLPNVSLQNYHFMPMRYIISCLMSEVKGKVSTSLKIT